jgi:hypothetical protein
MATSASPPPDVPVARPRFSPGFGTRLGVGLGLALLLSYALLTVVTIERRGGLVPYVVASDLISNLSGAAILESGHPELLYDRAAQSAAQAAILREGGLALTRPLPFIHLPFEALLVAALHGLGLSYTAVFGVWTLLGLAAIGAALAALQRGWPLPGRQAALLSLAALSFFPLYIGLLLGQSTALLLPAWAAGSAALRRGRDGWAGAAFALALIKPQALPALLLVLLLMRRWRALGAFAAVGGGAIALTLPFLGWDWPLRYLQLALSVGGYPPDPVLNPAGMQNWRGLIIHLLGDTALANTVTLVVSGLSLLGLAALWLGPGRGRWQPDTPTWSRLWIITLFANLLVTPYLLPHDLALAVVPGWLLAAGSWGTGRHAAWLGLGWALGFTTASPALPVPPAVLWMLLTVGWLAWEAFRTAIPRRAPPDVV